VTTNVRVASGADAVSLHALAIATFPLACPPGTPQPAIDSFIARHLSEASFSGYLADAHRVVLIAAVHEVPAGYAMLILGEPTDADVGRAISVRPTAELSKFYVLPEHHGRGVAATLMSATIEAARQRGAAGVWLGVNQQNARAARFYEKCGFRVVGAKRFRLADRVEHDFVRERVLGRS
jgi:ribosomal protein S18 acetylase RimI-like enzyme